MSSLETIGLIIAAVVAGGALMVARLHQGRVSLRDDGARLGHPASQSRTPQTHAC